MTLAELAAQITGLSGKLSALEADKATAATALAAETTARTGLEAKLTEVTAELARVKAATPPPGKGTEDPDANPHAAAIEALEKAITVLKATSPAPEKDDKIFRAPRRGPIEACPHLRGSVSQLARELQLMRSPVREWHLNCGGVGDKRRISLY